MQIHVVTEIVIARDASTVAAFAADPDNAPKWYVNIKSVEWQTKPPLQVGSRLAFVAHFLGKRLAYTYEFVEFVPGERLVMKTSEGPFRKVHGGTSLPAPKEGLLAGSMETTYTWERLDDARTRMTLRNRGNPTGFSKMFAPLMAFMVKRANKKDLEKLKSLLE